MWRFLKGTVLAVLIVCGVFGFIRSAGADLLMAFSDAAGGDDEAVTMHIASARYLSEEDLVSEDGDGDDGYAESDSDGPVMANGGWDIQEVSGSAQEDAYSDIYDDEEELASRFAEMRVSSSASPDGTTAKEEVTGEFVADGSDGVSDNGQEFVMVGTIWIGDSRFVGMDRACSVDNGKDSFVVAKVGKGLAWLQSEALPQAMEIRNSHPEIQSWRYVIGLGVNDLGRVSAYESAYDSIMSSTDARVVFVSVNPVGEKSGIPESKVHSFNDMLRSLGADYVDTCSVLEKEGFEADDGVHYSYDTYRRVYRLISDTLAAIMEDGA